MFETIEQAKEHFDQIQTKEAHMTATLKTDEGEEGEVSAAFSIFNELDTDGDVVLASAFEDGQEVGMVWSHAWGSRAIGKGKIHVEEDRAVFRGKFFTDTFDGMEAYKTVKNMGNLQEWSWGFRVTDSDIEEDDSTPLGYKRIIKGTEVYEVSPVLIGANRNTSTLSIKTNSESYKTFIKAELEQLVPVIVEKVLSELQNSEESDTIVDEEEKGIEEKEANNDIRDEAFRVVAEYEAMQYGGIN